MHIKISASKNTASSNIVDGINSTSKTTLPKKKAPPSYYYLGAKYGKISFTKREAECMLFFLKGKTINKVAEVLSLSPRTVEYYIKGMKRKVGCRTKFELVDLVRGSAFIKNLDDGLRVLL